MKSHYSRELEILFGAICDGLRQEVRYRCLAQLIAPKEEMSLSEEREAQLVASLAYHIRMVGFIVQIESYFYEQPAKRRPDLAILLPVTQKYLFLEVKNFGPYSGYDSVIEDIEKLENISAPKDKRNGLIVLGFRSPVKYRDRFQEKYRDLSAMITKDHPYREIDIRKIELEDMDARAVYAMIGLWVRKHSTD